MRDIHMARQIPLLIIISVVAIILFIAMLSLPRFMQHSLQADLTTTAVYLAQESLEGIIADKVAYGYRHVTAERYLPESFSGDYSLYRRSTMIREVSPEDFMSSQMNSGYKRVDIRVEWGDQSDQAVEVSTLLTEYH